MDPSQMRITAEPLTTAMCRFTVDRPVYPGESFYFNNRERAAQSALASQLFQIEGVSGVLISHDQVTVSKGGVDDWPILGKKIGATIRQWAASGQPAVSAEARQQLPAAEVLRERVQDVLDMDINPAVASHGGFVELIDVNRNDVYLRMGGGCQGCGMASMTLRQGVESAIRRSVPEVGAIFDTTDHAAGRNPYYAPAGH
ncbi:MAG: NifU family protein [Pirellulaceae bacterium]